MAYSITRGGKTYTFKSKKKDSSKPKRSGSSGKRSVVKAQYKTKSGATVGAGVLGPGGAAKVKAAEKAYRESQKKSKKKAKTVRPTLQSKPQEKKVVGPVQQINYSPMPEMRATGGYSEERPGIIRREKAKIKLKQIGSTITGKVLGEEVAEKAFYPGRVQGKISQREQVERKTLRKDQEVPATLRKEEDEYKQELWKTWRDVNQYEEDAKSWESGALTPEEARAKGYTVTQEDDNYYLQPPNTSKLEKEYREYEKAYDDAVAYDEQRPDLARNRAEIEQLKKSATRTAYDVQAKGLSDTQDYIAGTNLWRGATDLYLGPEKDYSKEYKSSIMRGAEFKEKSDLSLKRVSSGELTGVTGLYETGKGLYYKKRSQAEKGLQLGIGTVKGADDYVRYKPLSVGFDVGLGVATAGAFSGAKYGATALRYSNVGAKLAKTRYGFKTVRTLGYGAAAVGVGVPTVAYAGTKGYQVYKAPTPYAKGKVLGATAVELGAFGGGAGIGSKAFAKFKPTIKHGEVVYPDYAWLRNYRSKRTVFSKTVKISSTSRPIVATFEGMTVYGKPKAKTSVLEVKFDKLLQRYRANRKQYAPDKFVRRDRVRKTKDGFIIEPMFVRRRINKIARTRVPKWFMLKEKFENWKFEKPKNFKKSNMPLYETEVKIEPGDIPFAAEVALMRLRLKKPAIGYTPSKVKTEPKITADVTSKPSRKRSRSFYEEEPTTDFGFEVYETVEPMSFQGKGFQTRTETVTVAFKPKAPKTKLKTRIDTKVKLRNTVDSKLATRPMLGAGYKFATSSLSQQNNKLKLSQGNILKNDTIQANKLKLGQSTMIGQGMGVSEQTGQKSQLGQRVGLDQPVTEMYLQRTLTTTQRPRRPKRPRPPKTPPLGFAIPKWDKQPLFGDPSSLFKATKPKFGYSVSFSEQFKQFKQSPSLKKLPKQKRYTGFEVRAKLKL